MPKLLLLLVVPLALLALPGIVIVDWRKDGLAGERIVVPVPAVLAQAVLPFVPRQVRTLDRPVELERWYPLAERFFAEIEAQPDFVLAEVTTSHERVLVRKAGRDLLLEMQEQGGEEVHCRLPLRSADRLLKACRDGRLSTSELAHTLWSLPAGDFVSFSEGGETVRVRIWKL